MKKVCFFVCLCIILLLIITIPSFAMEGMITKVYPNGNVVINKGLNKQIKPMTVYYVTRMSKPIATIKVIQVDDYNATCRVEELVGGNQVNLGDVFSDIPFDKPEEKKSSGDIGKKDEPPMSDEELEKEKLKKKKEYQKKIKEYEKKVSGDFKDIVKKKTKVLRFKRGSGGTIKINVFDTYNFLSTIVFAGQYASVNPWYAASYAYGSYASYKSSMNPKRVRHVQLEITYWDADYLNAYASYYAYKEVVQDPRRVKLVRENIYRQKGLDKFYVFQVKIVNPGPGAVQFAPFPWHFYLQGKEGKRLKADHYDEILDKALNPNQVVNGYLYFSRYDKNRQPVIEGKGVTVILEDILGNKKNIHFE
ncbi:MAG: hypothetical protein K8T10_01905 [Candidatus Eremiobacteraeota bacterium]|nr:hypothetical protein [Candidatus Eremiobacteraeota bacterium]